jgi:hypothetical protein
MKRVVHFLAFNALIILPGCGRSRVTTADTVVGWPTDGRVQTLRAHLHVTGSGAEARALLPDLTPVYVDVAEGKHHPTGILPFTYYWSASAHVTVSICNVGKTVFICPFYVGSRLALADFGRCDVEPTYLSVEQAP